MSDTQEVQTVEVDVSKKYECTACKREYPRDALHFPTHGAGMKRICHECDYAEKKAQGKNPRQIPSNGKPKEQWESALPPLEKKPSPWITSSSLSLSPVSSSSAASQSPVSSSSDTASSTSTSTTQKPTARPTSYSPNARFTKMADGTTIIRLNNYFTIDEVAEGSVRVVHRGQSKSVEPKVQPGEIGVDFTEEDDLYDEPQDIDRPFISPHDQLYRLIEIYPQIAERLGLTFDMVETLTEPEAESKLEIFMSLSDLGSNFNLAKTALLSLTNVVEGISRQPRISQHVDLTGLTADVAQDPQIDSLLKEVVDQYRDEIAENMSPEVKLLSILGIKSLQISFSNKRKKQLQNPTCQEH